MNENERQSYSFGSKNSDKKSRIRRELINIIEETLKEEEAEERDLAERRKSIYAIHTTLLGLVDMKQDIS